MGATIQEGNQWVYHPEHGAKLIWLEELPDFLHNGWYCTPDDFPKVNTGEELPEMSKKEIYAYGKSLGMELVWRVSKDTLISQIEEHLNGNG